VFARTTTISGDPELTRAGIDYLNGHLDAIIGMDGCVGLSMMVDRDSGMSIATTSWRSAEEMHDSMADMTPMRERLARTLGGEPLVEEWEVAMMHRDHVTAPGAWCRVTWLRTGHADIDRGVDIYTHGVLPQLEELPGFCSASLMVNRDLGRACSTVSFDSAETMELSRDQAWSIRAAGIRDASMDEIDVAELELVMAHLRVPELT